MSTQKGAGGSPAKSSRPLVTPATAKKPRDAAYGSTPRKSSHRLSSLILASLPWLGVAIGVFGILIIKDDFVTGLLAVLACAALVMIPRAS